MAEESFSSVLHMLGVWKERLLKKVCLEDPEKSASISAMGTGMGDGV